MQIGEKMISLTQYKKGQDEDGKIDILNSGQLDNLFLAIFSAVGMIVVLNFL